MKSIPLNDLEMFEVLQAAYPEKFPNDDDKTWDAAQEFADTICGFDEIADLLGRVAMLTMPIQSMFSDKFHHCLGKVEVKDGRAFMTAAVRRNMI
jgi:hypothetical protein